MNAIRVVISLFIVALIVLAGLGWIWTGAHQPPPQATASHVALGLTIVAGVVGMVVIWRARSDRSGHGPAH